MKDWDFIYRYDGEDVSILTQIIDIQSVNFNRKPVGRTAEKAHGDNDRSINLRQIKNADGMRRDRGRDTSMLSAGISSNGSHSRNRKTKNLSSTRIQNSSGKGKSNQTSIL